jgi:hypothetical protein
MWPLPLAHLPVLSARQETRGISTDAGYESEQPLVRHRFSDSALFDSRGWAPMPTHVMEPPRVSIDMRRCGMRSSMSWCKP